MACFAPLMKANPEQNIALIVSPSQFTCSGHALALVELCWRACVKWIRSLACVEHAFSACTGALHELPETCSNTWADWIECLPSEKRGSSMELS